MLYGTSSRQGSQPRFGETVVYAAPTEETLVEGLAPPEPRYKKLELVISWHTFWEAVELAAR